MYYYVYNIVLSERLLIFSVFDINVGFKSQVKIYFSKNFLQITLYILFFSDDDCSAALFGLMNY